jgi:hypothetical protein
MYHPVDTADPKSNVFQDEDIKILPDKISFFPKLFTKVAPCQLHECEIKEIILYVYGYLPCFMQSNVYTNSAKTFKTCCLLTLKCVRWSIGIAPSVNQSPKTLANGVAVLACSHQHISLHCLC